MNATSRSTLLRLSFWIFCLSACLCLAACREGSARSDASAESREVVVFVSLDRAFSEPILRDFERDTGIRVRAVYDAEAAKTTGLVNRLLARADQPECDVHWNNESVQTAALAEAGLLEPCPVPNAERIPTAFCDPEGRWYGFAARLRVIIYNTDLISADEVPVDLARWTDPALGRHAAIAEPYFGTTFTHVSVLRERWGDEGLVNWLRGLRAAGVAFAPGNGPVRDLVAAGERRFGLTDTDDAFGAIRDGKPVAVLLPDSSDGPILIPNTVARIRDCPNPDAAAELIDYLLSAEVEARLSASRSAQIVLGRIESSDDVTIPDHWNALRPIRDGQPIPWSDPTHAVQPSRLAHDREALVALLRSAEGS